MNLIYQNLKYFYRISCQDASSPKIREHLKIPSLSYLGVKAATASYWGEGGEHLDFPDLEIHLHL